jgi:ribonuclease D
MQKTGSLRGDKRIGMRKKINSYEQVITGEEILALPLASFPGEIIVIEDPRHVPGVVKTLKGLDVVGFDTETRPAFKKGVIYEVALLQFATHEKAYIFRLNKTGLPPPLASFMANSTVIKAGAAIRDDIRSLQRLSRFNPAGFVELQEMVKEHDILETGLRKMAAIVLGIQISKSQQVSNWERKVLTDAQLIYAATDAWVCYEIYRRLTED